MATLQGIFDHKQLIFNMKQQLIINQIILMSFHIRDAYRDNSLAHELDLLLQRNQNNSLSRSIALESSILQNSYNHSIQSNYNGQESFTLNPKSLNQSRQNSRSKISDEKVRIGNIGQINKKIQNILAVIDSEQQRKSLYGNKYSIQIPNENVGIKKFHFGTIKSIHNEAETNLCRTPLKERPVGNNRHQYSNLSSIKSQHSPHCNIGQKQSKQIIGHFNSDISRTAKIVKNIPTSHSRSRIRKNKQNEDVMVRGKNVDLQINKIQSRIQRMEQMKKGLNISFDSKESYTPEKYQNQKVQNSRFKSPEVIKQHYFNKYQLSVSKVEIELQIEKKEREEEICVPKILRELPSKRKKIRKEQPILPEESFSQFKVDFSSTESSLPIRNIKRQISQGCLTEVDRRMNSTNYQSIKNNELILFFLKLQKQIKADEIFRKIKKWFQRWKVINKWSILQIELKQEGLWVNQECMKIVFSITAEQENPFYSPRSDDFEVSHLIAAFRQSQEHWVFDIQHTFNRQALRSQGLVESVLDISGRGYISIEDLVRYLNFELDKYYRNRDLYLIYHRLSQNETLYFKDLIDLLSK